LYNTIVIIIKVLIDFHITSGTIVDTTYVTLYDTRRYGENAKVLRFCKAMTS